MTRLTLATCLDDVTSQETINPDDLKTLYRGLDADTTDEDEKALYEALDALPSDVFSACVLVSEQGWKDYAMDQGADALDHDHPLYAYVDWDRWAEDLQHDYSVVEIGGVTFYYQ